MLPLKESREDRFVKGITFDDVLGLYLFDRAFRILVFDLIKKLEIAFRTQLIYQPSLVGGAFWYQETKYFSDPQKLVEHLRLWIRKSGGQMRSLKITFIPSTQMKHVCLHGWLLK
jgi:abortive infection bacteriophage resistance protein